MPRRPTVHIPQDDIDAIYAALDILAKIDDGRLTTRRNDPDPSTAFPSGRSFILLHERPDGLHVATTHEVYDRNGVIRHRHGKDIWLGEHRLCADREPSANTHEGK